MAMISGLPSFCDRCRTHCNKSVYYYMYLEVEGSGESREATGIFSCSRNNPTHPVSSPTKTSYLVIENNILIMRVVRECIPSAEQMLAAFEQAPCSSQSYHPGILGYVCAYRFPVYLLVFESLQLRSLDRWVSI
jgi:hypothetical protein